MKKQWDVDCDGVKHSIYYKQGGFGNKLTVDDKTYKVKSANWFINVVDYVINFGSTECRLVVIGTKIDLAVNGTFLGSKEPYEPVSNTPGWVYVLVGLSTIGGYFFSGLFGMMIGILMSSLYVTYGMKKKPGVVIGGFIGCCVIQFMLGFFIAIIAAGL